MKNFVSSTLELLPDEILLEICRYLHSGDVLYAFFNLNTRLNRTVTFYRQHLSLHRTFYRQFNSIFTNIIPQIQFSILSLVIYELESPAFFSFFRSNQTLSNLKKLTLINWTDEKLILFLETLHGMTHFHELRIQALDLTSQVKHRDLLRQVLSTNDNLLTDIHFDHECDALNLSDEELLLIFPQVLQLSIELQTITDLCQLTQIVPNLERLQTSFKCPWTTICSDRLVVSHLKDFSVYAMSHFSTFNHLKTLIGICPTLETLSLVLVTHDYSMVNGQSVLAIVPPSIKQFHYSICYHVSDWNRDFRPSDIIQSWKTQPIAYSISEIDKRIFLHTLFYQSSRLSLRSLFHKQMSVPLNSPFYSQVRHLHIYDTIVLTEIFGILRHCLRVVDLTISIRSLPPRNADSPPKAPVVLPSLHRLDFLSIQGSPPDIFHIEKILSSACHLSAMSIDFDCLYKLLTDDEQSLLLYQLFHQRIVILCVRFEDSSTTKLTAEHIHSIARIFFRVNHMCMDMRNCEILIESDMISLILNSFPKLMVLSMYGRLAKDVSVDKDILGEYLIGQSTGRLTSMENFQIDYGNDRLKVWM